MERCEQTTTQTRALTDVASRSDCRTHVSTCLLWIVRPFFATPNSCRRWQARSRGVQEKSENNEKAMKNRPKIDQQSNLGGLGCPGPFRQRSGTLLRRPWDTILAARSAILSAKFPIVAAKLAVSGAKLGILGGNMAVSNKRWRTDQIFHRFSSDFR